VWADDTRTPTDPLGDERTALTGFLDYHRKTFELKCSGLTPQQMSERAVPPSSMSLHGLVRHLAGVERWWFRQNFAGEDVPILFYSDDDPGQDFDDLEGNVHDVFALWRDECERARQIVASSSLDDLAAHEGRRGPLKLRWVLLNMITEYARHNGHADLLRERIDGATGF
jgi:hypothetical protein